MPRKLTLTATMTCLLGAMLVAGCSTVPDADRAQTCATTDWQRYGENDGRLGVSTSDRADQFLDCQDLGQPADMTAYQTGRIAGLSTYCTAENGYDVGYDGRRYGNVCPSALEPDFLQGYNRGRKERPVVVAPSIGIGIGSGGVRTRVGVGVGVGIGRITGRWGYGRYGLSRWHW